MFEDKRLMIVSVLHLILLISLILFAVPNSEKLSFDVQATDDGKVTPTLAPGQSFVLLLAGALQLLIAILAVFISIITIIKLKNLEFKDWKLWSLFAYATLSILFLIIAPFVLW